MLNKTKTALLLCYISIASSSAAIVTPALPMIAKQFHLGNDKLQWIISIFLLGYVIGQLIYAPLANRFGRLAALRTGLSINIIGILICIIATWFDSFFLLIVGRGVTALGAAAGLVCTFILIRELLDEAAAKIAMSYSIISFTLGIAIAVTLGGIITQYWHWQLCFLILMLHGIVMLVLTWQFPETLATKQSVKFNEIVKNYQLGFTNTNLVFFSLFLGLQAAFAYCYATAAPLYTQTILHLSAAPVDS